MTPTTASGEARQMSAILTLFAPSTLGCSEGTRMSGTSDRESRQETTMKRT